MKTPDELRIAAAEADQLRTNPAFQSAVLEYRASAIAALIATEPTDADAIRARQAEIKAVDGLCQGLANAILRAPRKPMAVA